MLLFTLWAVLVLGALAGAGFSHYRYRVRHNRYYERLFARSPRQFAGTGIERNTNGSRFVPILTLVMVCLLVPLSVGI